MIINKIEKLKDSKYKIIIDDKEIITFDNVILKNNLLYKKEIDYSLYNKIVEDTDYYCLYNKVVKYILKRKRSEKEIREYLTEKNANKKIVSSIIDELKRINLINDILYCRSFINDTVYLSKKGINKIKSELIKQDISLDIIESELRNFDTNIFDDKAIKIITNKIKANKKYSNYYLKQKIIKEMINLGYEKEKIIEIINNNLIEDNTIVKNEFDKLYIKLSKKYDGNILYNKIKQNMLSKGFFLEAVNDLIEEKQKN